MSNTLCQELGSCAKGQAFGVSVQIASMERTRLEMPVQESPASLRDHCGAFVPPKLSNRTINLVHLGMPLLTLASADHVIEY